MKYSTKATHTDTQENFNTFAFVGGQYQGSKIIFCMQYEHKSSFQFVIVQNSKALRE